MLPATRPRNVIVFVPLAPSTVLPLTPKSPVSVPPAKGKNARLPVDERSSQAPFTRIIKSPTAAAVPAAGAPQLAPTLPAVFTTKTSPSTAVAGAAAVGAIVPFSVKTPGSVKRLLSILPVPLVNTSFAAPAVVGVAAVAMVSSICCDSLPSAPRIGKKPACVAAPPVSVVLKKDVLIYPPAPTCTTLPTAPATPPPELIRSVFWTYRASPSVLKLAIWTYFKLAAAGVR